MNGVFIGTCNWSDFKNFYPAGLKTADRLRYYACRYGIVEVDSTFYALMPPRNFASWAAATPDNFIFDVKAYRTLTRHGAAYEIGRRHLDTDPDLDPTDDDFERFKLSLEPLRSAGKLRAVQFQFPPWFSHSTTSLRHIDRCATLMAGYRIAVEFRHRDWLEPNNVEQTFDFLRERNIVYTIADEPQVGAGTVPPIVEVTSSELAIVRFHGRNAEKWRVSGGSGRDRYDYLYSPAELEQWARIIAALSERAREVHVLMNNNVQGQGLVNARQLQRLLGQTVTEDEDRAPVQSTMTFAQDEDSALTAD